MRPTADTIQMLDVAEPEVVEIEIRNDGQTVWISANGKTILRLSRVGELFVNDHRGARQPQIIGTITGRMRPKNPPLQ